MSLKEENNLRRYIVDIIKESLMRESAAIGTAAILARALADKIFDSMPSIGIVYSRSEKMKWNGARTVSDPKSTAIVLKLMPANNTAIVLSTASNRNEATAIAVNDRRAPSYLRRLGRDSFKGYTGDVLIFGTDSYDNYPATKNGQATLASSMNVYEEIGNEFITSYIANDTTRKKLVTQFGSAAAIGYFVAMFIVVLPQGQSERSMGHVSYTTADEHYPVPFLNFRNNTMTVSAENSKMWSNLDDAFGPKLERLLYLEELKPGKKIAAKNNLNFVTAGLKAEIAKNATYIHELQHLIQHAVYDTPVSHTNQIKADSDDILNTSHPLHPYGYTDRLRTSTDSEVIGLAKEKRPKQQHVKILSSVLRDMGAITGDEVKLAGINSAAFKVSENWLTSLKLGLRLARNMYVPDSIRKSTPLVYTVEAKKDIRATFAEDILTYMSDNYLTSMPSAKKDPDERAAQVARYSSPKKKKSVTRKYRLFLADLISDLAIASHQDRFDTSNQGHASLGFGPKDITKPKALEKYAKTGTGQDRNLRQGNIKKMEAFLKNKGGKLSDKMKKTLIRTSFPEVIFYSKTLDLFMPASNSHYLRAQIPKEWLTRTELLTAQLTKDLSESESKLISKDIIDRFFSELDLHIIISKSLKQSPAYERTRLRTVGGREGRVEKGIGNIGVAWYKRANGYVWEKLKNEYDAEFVTHTAGMLYTLYLIGTSNKEVTVDEAYTHRLTNDDHAAAKQLFFALLDEDIKKTATVIQSLSSKSRHKFKTPADFNAKKGDQYRRLAIDFIEVVQGIPDEDLNSVEDKAADFAERFGKFGVPNTSKKEIKDIIQAYIDSRELGKGPNAWRYKDLIHNFILQLLGYIGKKLLE
jgi:hypothetical protein